MRFFEVVALRTVIGGSLFAAWVHAQVPSDAGPAPAPDASPPQTPPPAPDASPPARSESAPVPALPDPETAPTGQQESVGPGAEHSPETLSPVPPAPASPAASAIATGDSEAESERLEDESTPGWFRVDSDLTGLTLWAGATHDLGGVGVATNVYAYSGAFPDLARGSIVPFSIAGFDVGPAFAFVDGAVAVTPMVGVQFDWTQRRAVALAAPQTFLIVHVAPVYFESWVQCFFHGLFTDGASGIDNLTTRNFLLYQLGDSVAVGPHMELTYLFQSQRVASLPVGGATMLNYGKNTTLLLALGYETDSRARAASGGSGERGLFGRFTFIQTW